MLSKIMTQLLYVELVIRSMPPEMIEEESLMPPKNALKLQEKV